MIFSRNLTKILDIIKFRNKFKKKKDKSREQNVKDPYVQRGIHYTAIYLQRHVADAELTSVG